MSIGIKFNDRADFANVVSYAVADGVQCVVDALKAQDGDALKAARLNAASVAATAEIEGMKAANEDRRQNGYAMAYDAAAFDVVVANLRKEVEEIIG